MRATIKNILCFIFSMLILQGCLPDYEKLPPQPFSGDYLPYSIYTHQMFYSLKDTSIISYNYNDLWDIGFETGENGKHVILNSADLLEVTNLGPVDFIGTTTVPSDAQWTYDASSGNYDSLAINNWVDTSTTPYTYSHNVYVIGKKTGLDRTLIKKIKIIELTSEHYKIVLAKMQKPLPDTIIVAKNKAYNFMGLSVRQEPKVVAFEPEKDKWDILFTQYSSILYTDDGIPTPYSVRGVLLNRHKTKAAKYTINDATSDEEIKKAYDNIDSTMISHLNFSGKTDIIGYEWKDVTIDEGSNSAFYKADPKMVYIIKTQYGHYYKIHFISYYNSNGEKGFPLFEYERIK